MEPRPNLADPDFEPTDEQLAELMRRAFAGVPAQLDDNRRKLREQIAAARRQARQRFTELQEKARSAR